MTRDQALVLLERCLLVAFPYTHPKDDPDPNRGREQVEARAALALLAGPKPAMLPQEAPDQPYTIGEIAAF